MNKENRWVWFDMDGTLANFYGVDGWLDDLNNKRVRPYVKAKVIYPLVEFLEVLADLKSKGYKLGVVSWLSRSCDKIYAQQIDLAKRNWLRKYLIMDLLDEVIIVPYGTDKSAICERYGTGILVDDEEPNRVNWKNGDTIDANKNIIEILRKLA